MPADGGVKIVGLFPGGTIGGVQESGREAWRAVVKHVGEEHAYAFQYETGASKAGAVVGAFGARKSAPVVLVWHLGLVKLLPFFDRSARRVAVFLHGVEAWRRQDTLTQSLLRNVHLFISNSEFTWARFVQCNPRFEEAPHCTVHLGAGAPLAAASPAPDRPVALVISRLSAGEDYKGHRQLIDAWPRVVERVPGAQLWVVGDGDLRPVLEQRARERVADGAIQFLGCVPDVRKEQLINQARCLVMPSRGEGFGLVYLEAMRLGRPCLVSRSDAGREVVAPPEAGLAVDPDDPRELTGAVCDLLTDGPGWRTRSAGAKARYERRFTAAHFGERLISALFA